MSDLKVDGFKSSEILAKLGATFNSFSDAERAAQVKKTAAIFELRITNAQKQEAVWTLDFKDKGTIYVGPARAPSQAGVTFLMSDDTFEQLSTGELDGTQAFMRGKLKAEGDALLALKLSTVLETAKAKAKL